MKTISKFAAIAAAALYGISILLEAAGVMSFDSGLQHTLLSVALIAAGIYIIVTVKRIVFGLICFAAALALLYYAASTRGLLPF